VPAVSAAPRDGDLSGGQALAHLGVRTG